VNSRRESRCGFVVWLLRSWLFVSSVRHRMVR
jgi:hypothetical protein